MQESLNSTKGMNIQSGKIRNRYYPPQKPNEYLYDSAVLSVYSESLCLISYTINMLCLSTTPYESNYIDCIRGSIA